MKHHTAPLLLTAAAGLLTACTPRAWPLITGTVLLAGLLLITLLASTDQRTPFERIVVLLCILHRIDPRPYLSLPEPARQKGATPGTVLGQIPARRSLPSRAFDRPSVGRRPDNGPLSRPLAGIRCLPRRSQIPGVKSRDAQDRVPLLVTGRFSLRADLGQLNNYILVLLYKL